MDKNVLLGLLATCVLLLISVSGNAQDRIPAKTSPPSEFLNTLSTPERAWLRDHPVISVAQDPGWPPIEFADEHGTPSGMTADYLRLIEERLGVKFQQVKNLSWQEAYAQMQRWEIDMTTSVAATPERETFWAFTKPYMTIPLVIVTRSDVTYIADLRELEGKKVAVVAGYVAETWIARDFSQIQLVKVQTTQEALARLQRGEVFACVENMLVVDRFITELKMSDLKITGSTPYNNAQCMAVRKDWAILAGILDQALDSISATERNTIFRKWLPLQYPSAFDYTRLWPVAAILGVVFLGLGTWNWKLAAEIRQRKQAEAELRESETKFRAVAELSPMAIYASSGSEQKAVYINEAFYKIFGFSMEDVPTVGHWWIQAFPDEKYRQQVMDQWTYNIEQAAKINTDVEVLECACTCKDGSAKSIAWVGKTIGDEFWAFGYDFTERRRAEEEIRQLNQTLEERVVKRTAQLAAANQELVAFSYSVSHDLRAPLRAMDGFSAALLEDYADQLDEVALDHLRRIRAGSQRMGVLVDDLLNLSHESRAEMRRERVDITALVREIGADLQRDQPDHQPEWRVAPDLIAGADARMLRVVLTNLLGNAWKFTSHRAEARIEVGTLTAEDALCITLPGLLESVAAATVFFVRDNGAGFDMAYANKLFGAFQRLHSQQEFDGTGIGLALVQRIIHRHGGHIWAVAKVNEGATFFFTLGRSKV